MSMFPLMIIILVKALKNTMGRAMFQYIYISLKFCVVLKILQLRIVLKNFKCTCLIIARFLKLKFHSRTVNWQNNLIKQIKFTGKLKFTMFLITHTWLFEPVHTNHFLASVNDPILDNTIQNY